MIRDDPEYNTHAVAERTGIPASTFIAWERRHGIPRPHRTARNQRLYSERDIAQIEWLRDRTAQGLTITQAIAQLQATQEPATTQATIFPSPPHEIQTDIVVSMTADREISSSPPLTAPQSPMPSGAEREPVVTSTVNALRRLDEPAAHDALAEFTAAGSTMYLIQHVIPAVIAAVDQLVRTGEASPIVERLAHQVFTRRLGALLDVLNPGHPAPLAVVAGVSAETREIESLLLAIELAHEGHRVLYLGLDLPLADLVTAVVSLCPGTVALAASTPAAARMLDTFQDHLMLRFEDDARPRLRRGGSAFRTTPDRADPLPAAAGEPVKPAPTAPSGAEDDATGNDIGASDR